MDLLTKAEKLRQEQSRLRQKTIELNKLEEPSEEQRAELNEAVDRLEAIEPEIRAATTAEAAERANLEAEARAAGPDGMDAEMRERVSLRSKASLTAYLRAALSGRMVDGAEAELQAAAQLQHGGIPLELWDVPRPAEERAETRADTATGSPATVGVNMDMIRPQVFAAAVLPRLGVEMPRVMSGTYATSTISTGLTAGARAKGDARESTAAAFTVQTTTPKSVSARMSIRIEDVASVGAENFESALRQNLALALSDALDDQGLNGNGTDPNLAGFFSRLTTGTDPSNVATFDAFVAAFAGGVDGLWAGMASQVAMIV
ncbi:MAG: phage major capsid protein, partial [Alphaproteobacteria bacterium]|nr:phage major capsid protein [Alphaproteobacteria bacterium]